MKKRFDEILAGIKPSDKNVAELAVKRLDSLTKPRGSLGRLEEVAVKYVSARGDLKAKITKPEILTFAGDHGVAAEGVSAFPQEVTPQMVANFANGGAAINVLTRHAGAGLKVIDIGVAFPCDFKGVISRKVAHGTANFVKGPAMTEEQALQAIFAGFEEAEKSIKAGSTILGTGDMGIANTTPSAALYSYFLKVPVANVAGRGTGVDDKKLKHKVEIIEKAMEINKKLLDSPLHVLAALGGYEIAGICGTVLAGAYYRIPVVVDGFISGAAALTAIRMNDDVMDYCFFSHLSAEAGHVNAMRHLNIKPILDLDLRLGEGTGAVLTFNIIEAGIKIMNEMATFSEAGVSKE